MYPHFATAISIDTTAGEENNEDTGDEDGFDNGDIPRGVASFFAPPLSEWCPDMGELNRFVDGAEQKGILDASRTVLERLFQYEQDVFQNGPSRPAAVEDAMLNISCAKLLLDFDTNLRM